MGSWEAEGAILKSREHETGIGFAPSAVSFDALRSVTGQTLIEEFNNLAMSDGAGERDRDDADESMKYPLRPYAEDCPYYLRMGACKFGMNCKFNHPVRKVGQEKEKDGEGFLEKSAKIECKYYLTAGGCKFGKSCIYNHSKEYTEMMPPELNFLGLPIRPGERECLYYMQTGSCRYGADCRFHHPDPKAVEEPEPYNSASNSESIEWLTGSLGNHNNESIPLHLSREVDKTAPNFDSSSSYLPVMHSFSEGIHPNPEWNGYQASIYPHEKIRHPHSAAAVDSTMKDVVVSIDHHQEIHPEEFPERPGESECAYFMKTGDCKFKSACRYHHPKVRGPNLSICDVNDRGLPLRPGRKSCWHYMRDGVCKYGRECLFDHPNFSSLAFPLETHVEFPSGGNPATLGWT